MSFENYDGLRDAVIGWMDNTDANARVDDFISLAHTRLNRDVKLDQTSELAYYYTTAGSPWVIKPQLYNGMRRLKINGVVDPATNQPDDPNGSGCQTWALTFQPLTRIDEVCPANQLGPPRWYSVMADRFRLAPIPDAVYQIETLYYQTVPTLGPLQTTNQFLEQCSDLVLYASLIEAMLYLENPERASEFVTAYTAGLDALNDDTEAVQFPDGDLAMKAV